MTIKEQAEQQSQMHGYMLESERQAFIQGFVEAKTIKLDNKTSDREINKTLLHSNIQGYVMDPRYSNDENTDKIGRWARVLYYNGLQIAWINGHAKDVDGKCEHRLTGKASVFIVHLGFPISGQGTGGGNAFDNYEDAENFAKSMFESFKAFINE